MNLKSELQKVTLRSCASTKYQTGCIIRRVDSRYEEILSKGWSHKDNGALNRLYSMHAEIHALSKLGKHRRENYVYDAYIMTIRRDKGTLVNSAPCQSCAVTLQVGGVRRINWMVEDGMFVTLDLTNDIALDQFKVYRRAQPCR